VSFCRKPSGVGVRIGSITRSEPERPRRTLFFYRSISELLAMETAAAAAWVIDCLLLVHLGASWHPLVSALWVLPVLVPFYFLDSLLLIWLNEMTTMQIQTITLMILWVAVPLWLGAPFGKMAETALHDFISFPLRWPSAYFLQLLPQPRSGVSIGRVTDGENRASQVF
jgi:hypothetical protein